MCVSDRGRWTPIRTQKHLWTKGSQNRQPLPGADDWIINTQPMQATLNLREPIIQLLTRIQDRQALLRTVNNRVEEEVSCFFLCFLFFCFFFVFCSSTAMKPTPMDC